MSNAVNLFDGTVPVSLIFRGTSGDAIKFRKGEVELSKGEAKLPEEFGSATKKLLNSPELKAIKSADTKLRETLKERGAVPSYLRRACYLIRVEDVGNVDDMIVNYITKVRPALVEEFLKTVELRMEEAKTALGSFYDARQYKTIAEWRDGFSIEYDWVSFAPPTQLNVADPALYRKTKQKIEESMNKAAEQIQAYSRDLLLKMLKTLEDSLVGKQENGRPQRFHQTGIDKLNTFFENFQKFNLTNDNELEEITRKASALMEGVDAEYVRKDLAYRERLGEQIGAVRAKLDGLVVAKIRKMDFSEEEGASSEAPFRAA